jgi:hypothetical protein
VSDKRIVKVWTAMYEVYAEWYVILTDASNKPVGLRLFNALVVYPDGYMSEYHVYELPLSIVEGIGLLGEAYAR